MAATYTARINAVDRAETHVLLDGFKINEVTNGINTLVCRVGSEDASYRPLKRQTVEIDEDDGSSPVRLIFGGTLRMVREHGWGMTADGDDAIVLELSADSYKTLASRRFVTESFASQSLKATFTSLVTTYLAAYGVTVDAGMATGPTFDALEFKVVRVDDIFNFLATLSAKYGAPFTWTIGYDKVAGMYQTGTVAGPWNLIESEFTTLESSTGDIEVEPTDENYANRIIVVWGNGSVIDLGPDGLNTPEQFVGDGVTNSFPLKYQLLGPVPPPPVTSPPTQSAIGYAYVNVPGGLIEFLGTVGTFAADWEYDPVTNSISRVAGPPALGYAFSVPYRGEATGEVTAEDAGEIAANGIWEDKILAPEIEDPVLAQSVADAELARRLGTGRIVRFQTRRMPGPQPGETITITVPKRNISGSFTVTDVATENDPGNVNTLVRTVTCNSNIHEQAHQTLTRWWSEKDHAGIAQSAGASAVPDWPLNSVQFNDNWHFGGARHVLYGDLFWDNPDVVLGEVKNQGLSFNAGSAPYDGSPGGNQPGGWGDPGHIGLTDPFRLEMGILGSGDFSMDLFADDGYTSSILMNAPGDINLTAGLASFHSPPAYGHVALIGHQSIAYGIATLGGIEPGIQTIPGEIGDSFSRFSGLNVIEGLAGLYQTIASLPYTVNTTSFSNDKEILAFINTAGTGTVFIPYHADAGSPDYRIFPITTVGRMFWFYNESGTMTLDAGTDGSNINGDASITLDAEQSVLLMRHDTGYKILSSHGFGTGSGSPGGSPGGGTPGGPVNAVQYHNPSGDFDGEAAFTYDEALDQLSLIRTASNTQLRILPSASTTGTMGIYTATNYSELQFGLEVIGGVSTARATTPSLSWWDNAAGERGTEIYTGETPGSGVAFAAGVGHRLRTSGLFSVYQFGGLGTGAVTGMGVEIDANQDGNGAAAYLSLQRRGGTRDYLWVDNTGAFRIGSAPPQEDGTPADTSGTVLGGAVTTLTALTADPGAPTNGDVWVRASGTTPTRLLELRIRDGGVSYTIAGITV